MTGLGGSRPRASAVGALGLDVTGPKNISDAELMAALKRARGIQSLAADALGITRQAVNLRIQGSPKLQEFCEELSERMLDSAEAVVMNSIINMTVEDAKWYLRYKGRKRGYVLSGCLLYTSDAADE